ncbi:hypothetical protein ANCDUO_21037 [Ancylostoma duodenale]|uniref:mRNA (guanine-N(7))-methyltransferase n=1 Tax=Ancylostoma duodenale TaxID=51022 RepID=A0A0C2FVH3_9BILA|nr:hypothetical protein ANCDUO_21037 [Ancylostoma duodenale]
MSSETVAQHYNAVRQEGVAGRAESRIFYLRNLNNWMKSELISENICFISHESVNLKSLMKSHPEFDLVSCQFALHYSFIDEQSARTFLRNATETLRPGGFLIGTLPDAERIV